jgi:hypothetical protein
MAESLAKFSAGGTVMCAAMVCTPDGTVMSESRFFCEREDHNFQITRLGRFPVK